MESLHAQADVSSSHSLSLWRMFSNQEPLGQTSTCPAPHKNNDLEMDGPNHRLTLGGEGCGCVRGVSGLGRRGAAIIVLFILVAVATELSPSWLCWSLSLTHTHWDGLTVWLTSSLPAMTPTQGLKELKVHTSLLCHQLAHGLWHCMLSSVWLPGLLQYSQLHPDRMTSREIGPCCLFEHTSKVYQREEEERVSVFSSLSLSPENKDRSQTFSINRGQ